MNRYYVKYKLMRLLRKLHLLSKNDFAELYPSGYGEVAKSDLFDVSFYRERYAEDLAESMDPVLHYLREGGTKGYATSLRFDGAKYLEKYADVHEAGIAPLVHYEQVGRQEKRSCSPFKEVKSDRQFIEESSLFDAEWYRHQYDIPDDVSAVDHYLEIGWKEGYNPSPQFEGDLYLSFYDDVRRAGFNPLLHYEKHGKNSRLSVNPLLHQGIDVLIISVVRPADGVYVWRLEFVKERLEKLGLKVELESLADLSEEFLSKIYNARRIIFNRPSTAGGSLSSQIIRVLLKFKKSFIIDIDDLHLSQYAVFSGRYKSNNIDFNHLKNGILFHSAAFNYAKRVFVSTDRIASELQSVYGSETTRLPNVISTSKMSYIENKTSSGQFKLLYASGSITHDYDASTVCLDLINILSHYQDVTLTILGHSGLADLLKRFEDRISKVPFCSFDDMLSIYAQHDLLLIPLDENPYNEAKSNIKYIEAGAVCTPVLARDCAEFKAAIRDGDNGFLYSNNMFEKFVQIYHDKDKLPLVGRRAYQDVLLHHSTKTKLPAQVVEWLTHD